ncbi:MAG: hypothetical protein MHPSP_001071 [Paramarteilia canceri]
MARNYLGYTYCSVTKKYFKNNSEIETKRKLKPVRPSISYADAMQRSAPFFDLDTIKKFMSTKRLSLHKPERVSILPNFEPEQDLSILSSTSNDFYISMKFSCVNKKQSFRSYVLLSHTLSENSLYFKIPEDCSECHLKSSKNLVIVGMNTGNGSTNLMFFKNKGYFFLPIDLNTKSLEAKDDEHFSLSSNNEFCFFETEKQHLSSSFSINGIICQDYSSQNSVIVGSYQGFIALVDARQHDIQMLSSRVGPSINRLKTFHNNFLVYCNSDSVL